MKHEWKKIIEAYELAAEQQVRSALVTVVHVEGSAYRRAGARMLVDEYGHMTGAISGGCLEGDALQKAQHAIIRGINHTITYDTSVPGDAIVGAQLGCEGVIRVLFEPIHSAYPTNPIDLLRLALETTADSVLLCMFSLQRSIEPAGTLLFYDGSQLQCSSIEPDQKLLLQLKEDSHSVFLSHQTAFKAYQQEDNTQYAFIQYVEATPQLLIAGAGNDAVVLAAMADTLGWRVTVLDGRASHAKPARFSAGCRVRLSAPERLLDNVQLDRYTCVVLLSHNFLYDLAVLEQLLTQDLPPYIGILGPAKKRDRLLDELAAKGFPMTDEFLSKVYGPVGLEIGAETAEEISVSIIAEIMSVLNNCSGAHLRDKAERIHGHEQVHFEKIDL